MLALFILAILATYFPIVQSYFQQDEWFDFGFEQIKWVSEYGFLTALKKALFSLSPIVQTYNLLNYQLFGIQNLFPAVTVLILLTINSLLWYKLIYSLSKNRLISSISILFGYLSFISSQSVTWVMPAVAIQFSFLFTNLSILSYLRFEEKKNWKSLLSLLLFLVLAIFSKFNSFFLIIFFPLLYLIRNYKIVNFKENLKKITPPILLFSFLFYIFFLEKLHIFKFGVGRFVQGKTQILINLFFLPLKSISQILISNPPAIYSLGEQLLTKYYRHIPDDFLKYIFFAEFLSIIFSFLFIGLFLITMWNLVRAYKNFLIFLVTFYFLSFIPYSLDLFSTGTGFLESRYYNLASFAIGSVFGLFFFVLWKKISLLKNIIAKRILLFFLASLLVFYFSFNIGLIQKNLLQSNNITKKRENILKITSEQVGMKVGKRFIIYIQDVNYFGTSDINITGRNFQTGFLYPFLVYNFKYKQIPHGVFDDYFFWDMNFQGVKKTDDYEIGLFYEFDKLKEYVNKNNFPIEYIYAFRFDYSKANKNNSFSNYKDIIHAEYVDITDQIEDKLKDNNVK